MVVCKTLFINDITVKGIDMEKMPHIYFCSNAVKQLIEDKHKPPALNWSWINNFIDQTKITISLECEPGMLHKIPPMIRIKTHIMYMMANVEFKLLKKNDSMKIIHGEYDLYCTSLQNMQKVTPDDYKHDRYE